MTVDLYSDCIFFDFVLVYLFRGVAVNRGGRTFFQAVFTHLLEVSQSKVRRFLVFVAMDLILLLTSLTRGSGSSGFDVVSHFGGCGFPAGRAIIEIDDHQHTDRTTLPTCMFVSCTKWGGASSRFSAEPWIVEFMGSPRKPMVEKFQGPRCGPTAGV